MEHQVPRRLTMINLPTDVFSCIVQHLQQAAWQRDQRLDDIAALRSVCRSLRHAVDLVVTHAAFHANVGAAEMRSTISRCTGLHTVKLPELHPEAAGPMSEALRALAQLRALDMPMFDGMQLEDWPRLSGLTALTLRSTDESHSGTILAVLPRLTALRSLQLAGNYSLLLKDLGHLTMLQRLTHLDLGRFDGITALAPNLPNLQSLSVCLLPRNPPAASLGDLSPLLPLTRLRRLSLKRQFASLESVTLTLVSNPMASSCSEGAARTTSLERYAVLPLQGLCHLATLQGIRRQAALQLVSWPPGAPFRPPAQSDLMRAAAPCDVLRELRLSHHEVTAEATADLATVAGRLRVLHLWECSGAMAPLIRAAVAVEEVCLRTAQGGGELLAALRPAANTLEALDTNDMSGQLAESDMEHLAALSGLTSLRYGNRDEGMDAIGAIVQLTRLRALIMRTPVDFDDGQLMQLSALRGLTSLSLAAGWHADLTGRWLAALAAARVPLRELRLLLDTVLPGCGAEAAISRLTRLTSLDLSVDTALPAEYACNMQHTPRLRRKLAGGPPAPLQLQLLGRSGAAATDQGGPAAARNTGLQELKLCCTGRLSDDELAGAAAALPDLRRLEVHGDYEHGLPGLSGAGLAAFSACRRLRDIVLSECSELEGEQLLAHVPFFEGLATLEVMNCHRLVSSTGENLQAAFQARHGRQLHVEVVSYDYE